MDGKSDKAFSGLKKRIESHRTALKLVTGSEFVESDLPYTATNAMTGTHLAETEHDLQTHRLRLFHLVLPVRQLKAKIKN
jgi:hypothetical protein